MSAHKCAVESCQEIIKGQFLMCREHWRAVPGPLKVAVLNTWRRGGFDAPDYQAARAAAIRAVNGRSLTRAATPRMERQARL